MNLIMASVAIIAALVIIMIIAPTLVYAENQTSIQWHVIRCSGMSVNSTDCTGFKGDIEGNSTAPINIYLSNSTGR
jgi:hypothetical protein